MKRKIYLASLGFLLSACSTAAERFDSEVVVGVGAKSISKVNAMIDSGQLKGDESNVNLALTTPIVTNSSCNISEAQLQKIVLSDDCVVYRQNEEVARVWVAPFQDNSGNFYESNVIHTLLRLGCWHMQNNPIFS